jgi:hypothetical protein
VLAQTRISFFARQNESATGLFKAALWGFNLDQEVALTPASRLMRFADLPDSYMKARISERAKPCYDGSIWMTQSYYDEPSVAFVAEVRLPLYRNKRHLLRHHEYLVWKAHELGALIQASSVGHPLALAYWFEYGDRDLEYAEWENTLTWLLPEVPPHVKYHAPADTESIRVNHANYLALSAGRRVRLLQSMERYRQAQGRRGS